MRGIKANVDRAGSDRTTETYLSCCTTHTNFFFLQDKVVSKSEAQKRVDRGSDDGDIPWRAQEHALAQNHYLCARGSDTYIVM
jgi:hypothetical protein